MFAVDRQQAKKMLQFAATHRDIISKKKDAEKKETTWHVRNDFRMWNGNKLAVSTLSLIIRKPWSPGKPAQYFVEPV